MRVRVLFFGPLKDITGTAEDEPEIESGSSLGALFDQYARRFPRLAEMRQAVVLARNREFAESTAALREGDEVAFLPPVSGGGGDGVSGEAGDVTITRQPISAADVARRLHHGDQGDDGAVVVFEGTVRNNSGGRRTRYLEYEAYEPMALDQMRSLAREALQQWPIGRIAIVHRLGRMEIGETSVAIVVTSPHRAAAFEACRSTIDRLKKTVPIWKKEHFEDGEIWVEGEWDASLRRQP